MLRAITRNIRLELMAAGEARATMANNGTTATPAGSERKAHLWRFGQRLGLSSAEGAGSSPEDVMTSILNPDERNGANATLGTSLKRLLFHATRDRSKVEASKAVVQDISGGCGSMYKIEIESPLFRGKGLVAQHRMVKDALKAEIADMHGLTLHTRPSPE